MINEETKLDAPSEADLLAYVEGTLSDEECASIERRLGSDERALLGLSRLRDDRKALCALQNPEPPASLLDDCISVVERSVLISEGPMAPPIAINRYRSAGRWRRYAAAALFFIVVGGGGWWIARTTMFKPHDPGFLTPEEQLARQNAQARRDSNSRSSQNDNASSGPSSIEELIPGETSVTDRFAANLPAIAESVSDAAEDEDVAGPAAIPISPDRLVVRSDEAPFEAPSSATDDVQLTQASIETDDPGFGVRVSAVTNRAQTMDQLRALIAQQNGTALVYNAPPLERQIPIDEAIFSDPGTSEAPAAASNDRNGNDSGARPPANSERRSGSGSDRESEMDREPVDDATQSLVALLHQHEYREAGFDYTLVGTPSQIQAILRSLNEDAQFGGRVRVRQRRSDDADAPGRSVSLDDLVPPTRPEGREWARAILWFSDPERNFPLAMRLHESYKAEPIIRVPIRITGE